MSTKKIRSSKQVEEVMVSTAEGNLLCILITVANRILYSVYDAFHARSCVSIPLCLRVEDIPEHDVVMCTRGFKGLEGLVKNAQAISVVSHSLWRSKLSTVV